MYNELHHSISQDNFYRCEMSKKNAVRNYVTIYKIGCAFKIDTFSPDVYLTCNFEELVKK